MAFHRAAVKSHAVNCADEINQDGIVFFGFRCFGFLLVSLGRRSQFFQALVNVLFRRFVNKARKFEFLWVNRVKFWNRFDFHCVF